MTGKQRKKQKMGGQMVFLYFFKLYPVLKFFFLYDLFLGD